jgi:tetratricopeptide (TPR) repeat protein
MYRLYACCSTGFFPVLHIDFFSCNRANELVSVHRGSEKILDNRKSQNEPQAKRPDATAGKTFAELQLLEEKQAERENKQRKAAKSAAPLQPQQRVSEPLPPKPAAPPAAVPKQKKKKIIEHPIFGMMEVDVEEDEGPPVVEPEAQAGSRPFFTEENILRITDMGFSRDQAMNALDAYDGDVERATAWLFDTAQEPAGAPAMPTAPPPAAAAAPARYMYEVNEHAVRFLMSMGFSEAQVKDALSSMDADTAFHYLTSQGPAEQAVPTRAPQVTLPPAAPKPAPLQSQQPARQAPSLSQPAAQQFARAAPQQPLAPSQAQVQLPASSQLQRAPEGPSVINCLIDMCKENGGELPGAHLGVLYSRHPSAKSEVQEAGGFRKFCAKFPDIFEYVPDPSGGPQAKVRLVQRDIALPGDMEIIGTVTRTITNGSWFMEGEGDMGNIYIPPELAQMRVLSMGQRVKVLASKNQNHSTCKWKAKAFLELAAATAPQRAQRSSVAHASPVQQVAPAKAEVQETDPLKALIKMGIREEDAKNWLFIFQNNLDRVIQHLREVGDLDEANRLVVKRDANLPTGKESQELLECIVSMLKSHGGQVKGNVIQVLAKLRPSASQELPVYGGFREFTSMYPKILEHYGEEKSEVLRLLDTHEDADALQAGTSSLITGRLTNKAISSWFMESKPGNADVFVPMAVLGGRKFNAEDVITVSAMFHVHGNNRWKAVSIRSKKLPNVGILFASEYAEKYYAELSSMRGAALAVLEGHDVKVVAGKAIKFYNDNLFLESPLGASDIWVPGALIMALDKRPEIGQYLSVSMVKNQQQSGAHASQNQWRVVEIHCNHGSVKPIEPRLCVCGACNICKEWIMRNKPLGDDNSSSKPASLKVVQQGEVLQSKKASAAAAAAGAAAGPKGPSNMFELLGGGGKDDDEDESSEEDGSESVSSSSSEQLSEEELPPIVRPVPTPSAASNAKAPPASKAPAVASKAPGEAVNKALAQPAVQPAAAPAAQTAPKADAGGKQAAPANTSGAQATASAAAAKAAPAQKVKAPSTSESEEDEEEEEDESQEESEEESEEDSEEGSSSGSSEYESEEEVALPVPNAAKPAAASTSSTLQQGISYKQQGNVKFANKAWQGAIEDYTQALKCFEKVSNLSQDERLEWAKTAGNRAQCFINLKMFDRAIEDCTKAISIDPAFSKALVRRATSHVCMASDQFHAINNMWNKDANTDRQQVNKMLDKCFKLLESATKDNDAAYECECNKAKAANLPVPVKAADFSDSTKRLHQLISEFKNKVNSDAPMDQGLHEADDDDDDGDDDDDDGEDTRRLATCFMPQCGGVLRLQLPGIDDVSITRAWSVTCPRCSMAYPWEAFTEFHRNPREETHGLTKSLHSTWMEACKAAVTATMRGGERFLESARNKAKAKGMDSVPMRDGNQLAALHGEIPLPAKEHSGLRILLQHCIRMRDIKTLAFLLGFPHRLDLKPDDPPSVRSFNLWITTRSMHEKVISCCMWLPKLIQQRL